jgi:hypothetical protein
MRIAAFVDMVAERHAMYQRRQAGQLYPWTNDSILSRWSFCNMYRHLDKTTRWFWDNWCRPHDGEDDLWFAMTIARLVNRIETLDALGYPVPWNPEHFIEVMSHRPKGKTYGPAYMIPAFAGDHRPKYISQVERIFTPMWNNREALRPRAGMLVAEFAQGLRTYPGMGDGFLVAQAAADAKPFSALRDASDFQTFAISGNGSRPGMNNVLGRPTNASWRKNDRDWYERLAELCALTAPIYQERGLPIPDFQDLQNQLCEFSKWWAIHSGEKRRLKREYKPAIEKSPKPVTERKRKPRKQKTGAEPIAEVATESPSLVPDYILEDAGKGFEAIAAAPKPEQETKADNTETGPEVETDNTESTTETDAPKDETASSGSWSEAKRDSHAEDNAGKPFDDAWLLRKGYQFVRAFDYTLPDGARLYQQRRYELLPAIPPIKGKRPRKRFLVRREINDAWVFGAGSRLVLYNWPAVMRAGPGATVFVPEGEGKVDDLSAHGLLAATIVSHKWAPECGAALTGRDIIILADHDGDDNTDGTRLAEEARRALVPSAASVRVVPYLHLWQHLSPEVRGDKPAPNEDISDWLKHGDASKLLDICREIATEAAIVPVDLWAQFEPPALPTELLPKTIADFAVEQGELTPIRLDQPWARSQCARPRSRIRSR